MMQHSIKFRNKVHIKEMSESIALRRRSNCNYRSALTTSDSTEDLFQGDIINVKMNWM